MPCVDRPCLRSSGLAAIVEPVVVAVITERRRELGFVAEHIFYGCDSLIPER
jgi:hypothetical protein